MGFLHQTLRVVGIHLTAAAVLFAGLPYSSCRCPDGRTKLFCLGLPAQTEGCCSGGCCCSASLGGKGCCQGGCPSPAGPAPKPCCHYKHDDAAAKAGSHPQVGSQGCRKTVQNPGLIAVAPQKGLDSGGPNTWSFALPSAALPFLRPKVGSPRLCWHSHPVPPPTDLVIAHLRLTI